MTRIDRRALFSSGAAAALLAATGLSAAPQRGGLLRAALSGATRADTWDASPDGLFMRAISQGAVFENLTEIAADGTLRAELATSWEANQDATIWRFHLRENVAFHDGSALGFADVVDSLTRAGLTAERIGGAISVRLHTADPNLPYRLAAPEFVIKPADPGRRAAGIGTGLYRTHKFDPGRHFIGERVTTHWKDGQAGWFDRVEFVHIPSDEVRAQALREGLVDVADIAEPPAGPFRGLPSDANTTLVASRDLIVPGIVGGVWPLDNFRMTERWSRA